MLKLPASTFVDVSHTELTPMQMKVLRGVHSGLTNKQIAFDIGIAEATVKVHMTALMRKLNVRNRTQAALLAKAIML
jgi:DNA-binding NarL/FixJ family response regulator